MNKKTNPSKESIFLFPKEFLSIVLFILLSIQNIFAENQIQQFESKLLNLPDDTVKVNILLKLGEHYCSIENDKALMFLQEAFTISTYQNYTDGIGKSLFWQGRVYYYKDDYPLSVKYLDRAEKILETTNELDALAFLYFAKGEICSIRGDYIHAMEMYKAAIQLTEKTGNLKHMSSFYNSMGMVLHNRKDPEKALGYFWETLSIKKLINDQQGISNTLTCIGKTYEKLGVLDSSLMFYNQALEIRSGLNMTRAIASSEYKIGGVLILMGKYEKAEESLKIALKNFTGLEEKTGIIITNLRLAVAQSRQGNPDAIERADNALEMARNIDNPNLISLAYKTLSDIYFFNNNYKE
ncbi:MAG: tetratricopeptide repeat protein, partial [Bacteroidales bacterium]|nr:tetratricopeptide repeat protein [Bacteroidales bacterium]